MTRAYTPNIKCYKRLSFRLMSVTHSCRHVTYSNSTEETGYCQNPVLSHRSVCEILSALVCTCQTALPSIWMTLMKGERGNNQRSQYSTCDTDACSYIAGRRDLLAAELSSDLTLGLGFNATFLYPAHLSRFLSHSLGSPSPTYLRPLSLVA